MLLFRAANFRQATQQHGCVAGGECWIPLCCSRGPRTNDPLEKGWIRTASGQVRHGYLLLWKLQRDLRKKRKKREKFVQLFNSSFLCVLLSRLQIRNPQGLHFDCPQSDLHRWGFLHMHGWKYGREVRGFRCAHGARSVQPDPNGMSFLCSEEFARNYRLLFTVLGLFKAGVSNSCWIRVHIQPD